MFTKNASYFYLSLDISLNKNAFILFKDNKIVNLFFVNLKNEKSLLDKTNYLTNYLKILFDSIKNEKIVIILEKPFIALNKNKNIKTTYDLIFLQGWISNFFKNFFTNLISLNFIFAHVWKYELFNRNISSKNEIIDYVNLKLNKNFKNPDICDAFCVYHYYQKKFLY